ncbi:hypothetical protein ABZP36_009139 [Zizania latifolia]
MFSIRNNCRASSLPTMFYVNLADIHGWILSQILDMYWIICSMYIHLYSDVMHAPKYSITWHSCINSNLLVHHIKCSMFMLFSSNGRGSSPCGLKDWYHFNRRCHQSCHNQIVLKK